MAPGSDSLLTDLYQLNMVATYIERGYRDEAVFELFVRRLPERRGFLMASGLEQALDYLEALRFTEEDIRAVASISDFPPAFLEYLRGFSFTGDVDALPEGSIFFANEPIIRVTAPLPEAQFVESRLINLLHFGTLISSKAARCILAAPGKAIVDFGFRRAHGAEAGVLAARSSYIAGFEGTATVAAGARFGIPLRGTMAHSFIQAHDIESEAFMDFARSRPHGLVLLIDTYDVERAAQKVVALAPQLEREGVAISGVRIDSGDLAAHSRAVRGILDAGGLPHVKIVVSGGLDEDDILRLEAARAPIDVYGVGTSMTTSSDAPALDCAYKLQEYAGRPRRKRSEGKATWPGRKQVWRAQKDGVFSGDVIGLESEIHHGEPLLAPVMRNGRRLPQATIMDARARASAQLGRLPEKLRRLEPHAYPVEISSGVRALAEEADRADMMREGRHG